MSTGSHDTLNAIRRWQAKGLLLPELAAALQAEVEAEGWEESRRWSQYLLAGTGGAVLVIAAGTFLAWVWPNLGFAGQSVTLALVGAVVTAVGIVLSTRGRWTAVAYFLQVAGPLMILMAAAWSELAWDDRTLPAVGAGIVALATTAVTLRVAVKKDPVLAALQTPLSFLFVYVFLDRALAVPVKTGLWILDGILVLALAFTAVRLRRPGGPSWLLGVFTSFLYASLVLAMLTGIVIWDMERFAIIPADIWLLVVGGLSVWGLQPGIPEHLRHEGYERQLAYVILLWIPFGFFTAQVAMYAGPNTTALMVAAVGALGLWYSVPRGRRGPLVTSCLVLLAAAWYYGATKAGALGAVLALVAMAGLLLWASSRASGVKAKAVATE